MTSLDTFRGAYLLDFRRVICGGSRCPQSLLDDCPLSAPLPELESFVSKSTRAFCSRGTGTNSNTSKVSFKI